MWANLTVPTVSGRQQLPEELRDVSWFQLPLAPGSFAAQWHQLLASDYASRLKVSPGLGGTGGPHTD
jgi:hypothetical protein